MLFKLGQRLEKIVSVFEDILYIQCNTNTLFYTHELDKETNKRQKAISSRQSWVGRINLKILIGSRGNKCVCIPIQYHL